jgi:hypothetical protein
MPDTSPNTTAKAQLAAHRIEALRSWRVRPERTRAAGGFIDTMARKARRSQREVGGFADAWADCVDPKIAAQTRILSFRGGVATIGASSASMRWVIDRELRNGLLAKLRATCPMAVSNVRVRNG